MEIEVTTVAGASRPQLVPSDPLLSLERGSSNSAYLVWEDLTVVLPNYGKSPSRKLLHGLNGYCEPGRIMAIMGPSGSGKSTLLDSLAGRLAGNVIQTGKILLNGKKRRLDYGVAAYVTQEDVLLGTLTIRETIKYSALLRLPTSMSKQEIRGVVDSTIEQMGLLDCEDRMIGNWHLRGISGGEKKRLSIAIEILTRPRLLFLDEPTSGLDSASAFFVIQTLRNMAHDGRTIISSIHQPSSEVFELFDDLVLLSGGETVYFGDAKLAIEFFAEAGFPCPSKRNPSDHFLRCVNSDFDRVTATMRESQRIRASLENDACLDPLSRFGTSEIKSMLVEKYKTSEYSARARRRIREISQIVFMSTLKTNLLSFCALLCVEHELILLKMQEGLVVEWSKGSQASWGRQLSTLCRRSFVNMSRDMGYYWMRIVIYIVVAICVGTIYFDVGTSYTAILARVSCGGFVSGFMTFMSIGGFPSFIEEMKVYYRERLNGHYGVAVYILSNFLSSFPFLLAVTISSGTITYYMVKFHPGFSHYAYYVLNLFGCIAVIESLMMIVASLVPNFLMGIITGAGIMGIMMMTAGFFRLLPDLPKPFWRYPISYMSYSSWSLQGQYKNDLLGLEFDPLIPGDAKLRGDDVIQNIFGIDLGRSKWWDLAAVFAILFSYRVIFFLILKFNELASPFFRTLYAKRNLKNLKKRPSFKKVPSFSASSKLSTSSRRTSSPSQEYLTHKETP